MEHEDNALLVSLQIRFFSWVSKLTRFHTNHQDATKAIEKADQGLWPLLAAMSFLVACPLGMITYMAFSKGKGSPQANPTPIVAQLAQAK